LGFWVNYVDKTALCGTLFVVGQRNYNEEIMDQAELYDGLLMYSAPYNRVVELFEKAYAALGRCWMSACQVFR